MKRDRGMTQHLLYSQKIFIFRLWISIPTKHRDCDLYI